MGPNEWATVEDPEFRKPLSRTACLDRVGCIGMISGTFHFLHWVFLSLVFY